MAVIAIRQPNNLLMLFSTVSCCPIEINLTKEEFIKEYVKEEFIKEYVKCFNNCISMTREQILRDAVDTVENHVNPWDRFLEDYIPMYTESEEDTENQLEKWIEKCSVNAVKESL